ncbi:MAG TPA: glycosyltransferase family 4 protein [Flavisolibacter sp.]|jgi:glycosyltransferase involved in cell wall biosynthesis|nr:glycosyltransferase family 4 protein [Flavisolibacter sp.]
MTQKKVRVLFLGQLPEGISPSQRFRIEAYKELLAQHNIEYIFQPFLSEKARGFIYKKGHLLKKVAAVFAGFLRRFAGVYKYRHVDFVFVQREASPVGPPVFEWLYAKVLGKKLIYDFDDAIWISNVTEGNQLAGYVKCYWKVAFICKWAYKVSVGNRYLGEYAARYNQRVVYNPTCVDTQRKYVPVVSTEEHPVTIGWTGSHSTLPCLSPILPVIKKLQQAHTFRFMVICDRSPSFDNIAVTFQPWQSVTEISNLSQFDIGIMPLEKDAWSEGKCGFKIIQYMALGIPALASPVGVNKEIIDHGINGYLCETEEEWECYLTELLFDCEKRKSFGGHGRKKIEARYSVAANAATFLSLFS